MSVLVYSPLQSQSKEYGTLVGKVLNDGTPVPGVAVSASSENLIGGARMAVSNEDGRFRFVALPPGIYELTAKLDGFKVSKKTGIRVSVNTTLEIDLDLEVGTINEEVNVAGVAPLIDVKDSQTAVANISNDLIQNLPSAQFVTNIVNLAPGVNNDSAFGGLDTGVAYQIDGVDVSDPELGSAYVFLDYGVVEESQIMGVGAPAEYDGFTGIAFNVITKSGSNTFRGMLDTFLQLPEWNDTNTDDESLTSSNRAYKNIHFNMGGPIQKDKLWFFGALQYYQSDITPDGFPEAVVYKQPRGFLKLTWQVSKDTRISGFFEKDEYTGVNRGASANTDIEAVRDQDSPEMAFNLNFVHIFSDYTFLEAKFGGFTSYYKLIPAQGYDLSGHYDYDTQRYSVNGSAYYHAYRDRYQGNLHVNHHADNFIKGSHDFKFGVEVKFNPTKSEWGYAGNTYYRDYAGEPYEIWTYDGYSFRAQNFGVSAFLQDSWSVSDRIKINPGIRMNYVRGKIIGEGTVFTPEVAFAPRIGVTIDLLGDHTTAIKAHYGKYFEGAITAYYTSMAPKPDFVGSYWNGTEYEEGWRETWDATVYKMDDTVRLPHMNQYTIGIERQLMKDLSLSLTYIHRTNHDFIDRVCYTAEFEDVQFTDDYSGKTYTMYNQTNDVYSNKYIITNPDPDEHDIVKTTPERKYSGVTLQLNKRFSNNWGCMASYTYGKAEGNNDNYVWGDYSSGLGGSEMYKDPNYQINNFGRLTYDYTHMLKIQAVTVLPLQFNFSGYFSYISGAPYNRYVRNRVNQGVLYILGEERGSYEYDGQVNLDLRLEKTIKLSAALRLGVMIDVFNVFNSDTVDYVNTTSGDNFEEVWGLVAPRVFRVGLRLYIN